MSRIGGSRIETGIHSIIMRMGTIFIYREPSVVKLDLRAAEVCPLVSKFGTTVVILKTRWLYAGLAPDHFPFRGIIARDDIDNRSNNHHGIEEYLHDPDMRVGFMQR
jgi:hypothetical protein